jgi:hypothetical protein
MKYTKLIAIDPGLGGGIIIYSIPNKSIYCGVMPLITEVKKKKDKNVNMNSTDVRAIAKLIDEHKNDHNVLLIIEKVQARPQDADHPGKIFRIQKMLSNYDSLITVINLSGVDYVEVVPRVWQKTLNLSKEKNQNKAFAKNHYPMIEKITLKISDAVCILHFLRLKLKTDPKWVENRLNGNKIGDLL